MTRYDPPERARIRPYLDPGGDAEDAPPAPWDEPAAPPHVPDGQLPRLRPFVLTGGRVPTIDPELGIETQVTAVRTLPPWAAPVATLAPELQAILSLCTDPLSVAEISAQVPLHLGVAKVLVSDLRATGHLDIHAQDVADPHDPDLILRVIRGLRAIA